MTPEELQQVEELAELQFGEDEIALIVGIDPHDVRNHPDFQGHMRRGHLKGEAYVRRKIYQLAKDGSSPAQRQMLDLIQRRNGSTEPPDDWDRLIARTSPHPTPGDDE